MAESPLPLTPAQRAHYELMRSIAARLVDTPLILKGGTALLLCYASDRFSRDLDFDSTKKLNLESRILSSLPEGVEAVALDKLKDTKTVTRYRLTYRKDGAEQSLKIEVSHRDALDPSSTVVREGVRTYSLSRLIEQKFAAIGSVSV